MPVEEIVEYLKNGLLRDYKAKDLKDALKKRGWSKEEINEAEKVANAYIEKARKNGNLEQEKEDYEFFEFSVGSAPEKSGFSTVDDSDNEPEKSDESEQENDYEEEDKKDKKGKKKDRDSKGKGKNQKGKKESGKRRGFFGLFKRKKGKEKKTSDDNEKEEKKKKAKKPRLKTLSYEKPKGKLTTQVDDMLEIITQKKKIRTDQLARKMKVKESDVKEWTETLEGWGMIEVHYPLFGKPILTMAKEKAKKNGENQ